MAGKKQQFDSFTRGEKRQDARRHGTYTKNVSRNAAKKGKAMLNQSIVDILFCVLLPPYGIYRVWTQEKNLPLFKIACTLGAALILFLWFLLIIPEGRPQPVSVTHIRSTAIE